MYYLPLIALAVIVLPLFIAYRNTAKGGDPGKSKKALIVNLSLFAVICLASVAFPLGGFVSAATTTAGTASTSVGAGIGLIGAAIATGLSCVGAGVAVANGAAAAIGAVSENPKNFVRALIYVVLGEGIAIYGMIISIMIIGKIQ